MKTEEEIREKLKQKQDYLYSNNVWDLKPITSEDDTKTRGWEEALLWVLENK